MQLRAELPNRTSFTTALCSNSHMVSQRRGTRQHSHAVEMAPTTCQLSAQPGCHRQRSHIWKHQSGTVGGRSIKCRQRCGAMRNEKAAESTDQENLNDRNASGAVLQESQNQSYCIPSPPNAIEAEVIPYRWVGSARLYLLIALILAYRHHMDGQ